MVEEVYSLYLVIDNPQSGLIAAGRNDYIQPDGIRPILGIAVKLSKIIIGIIYAS